MLLTFEIETQSQLLALPPTLGVMMRRIRTLLFWVHLSMGATAGLVILVMSSTGAALALKPQILSLVERDVRFVAPAGDRLSPGAIVSIAREQRPGLAIQSFAVDRNPAAAAQLGIGPGTVFYVDPYSGQVLGT